MPTDERLEKITRLVKGRQAGMTLLLEDLHDPHNAGAIMRSCDAFGVQEVHLVFDQQKPFNPKRLGHASSSSANKWLDFRRHESIESAAAYLKSAGYELVATALEEDSKSVFEAKLDAPKIALMVGNEHRGLSDRALQLADQKVIIPMRGIVQSLNVSVATALLLFEITRRRIASGQLKSLSDEARSQLIQSLSFR